MQAYKEFHAHIAVQHILVVMRIQNPFLIQTKKDPFSKNLALFPHKFKGGYSIEETKTTTSVSSKTLRSTRTIKANSNNVT